MSTLFAFGANDTLGGRSDELLGLTVALRSEGKVQMTTEFGLQDIERVYAYSIAEDGVVVDMGLRLIFWAGVRDAVRANTKKGVEFTVGIIEQVPYGKYEDGTRYEIGVPDSLVENADVIEKALRSLSTPF